MPFPALSHQCCWSDWQKCFLTQNKKYWKIYHRHQQHPQIGCFTVNICECTQSTRFPLFYWQKKSRTFPELSRTPMKNFPGPFRSPGMWKYKEKTAFTHNIQNVVHWRKFSMKQNVDVSCSEFRWTYLHMVSMQWFRTLSFNLQNFPQPKWFSRTFQVVEFSRQKNPELSRRRGNPESNYIQFITIPEMHHNNVS